MSTFYPFAGYEQTNGGAVTKHYAFNGRFVAVRAPGGSLSFLLQDQINSTIHVLDAYANKQASRGYYTFGATRFSEGVMPTDHHFTSQKEDGTGLYYYGARYYDPQIGSFISPDTIVPDPNKLIDYNRYLYGYGNPVKYNDPSGHGPCPACPTIIIINGINQTLGVPSSNSVDLAQNLAEWGYTNTYQSRLIYTSGDMVFDAFTVGVQHYSNQGPWGINLEWTTGEVIRRMETDIAQGSLVLDPAQGAIIIGHSGGGPVAIGVAEYMETQLGIPVKGIVTI